MHRLAHLTVGLIGLLALAGCRTATRVTEVPRVDLELSGAGNRGYLIGTPPPAPEQDPTRQMVHIDVEIPSFYKPTLSGTTVGLEDIMPADAAPAPPAPAIPVQLGAAPRYETYVVQKGDSLWSIAAKAEIYGRASRWRVIFDANRDLLKSPDHLKVGMTLKIPRGEPADDLITYGDEGTPYKK